jgi:hypothetical protein
LQVKRFAVYPRLSKADLDGLYEQGLSDEQRFSKGIGRQRDDSLDLLTRSYGLPAAP